MSVMTWTEPARTVVELERELPLGRAVDIGTGDGHDNLWLAERGWSSSAVDLLRHYLRKLRAIVTDRPRTWLTTACRKFPVSTKIHYRQEGIC
jgi:hypothetical protein